MTQHTDNQSFGQENSSPSQTNTLHADDNGQINLPEGHFIGDANYARDGQDLIAQFDDDSSHKVEGFFSDDIMLHDSSGSVLNQELATSFLNSSPQYAQNTSLNDESPIGAIEEIKGEATVTHLDGSSEKLTLGTPIYEGDVIETSQEGAVNVVFLDETSLALSANARVALDNYNYDSATENGETNLSVLRGVFVYTSGLIGRDDPDDVHIQTPVGSIGIRGTIIAGTINPEGQSEISVLEGAIVVSNGAGERTLSQQYETVKLNGFQDAMEYAGVEPANDIGKTYGSVSDVLPKLFSSINDAIAEEAQAADKADAEAQAEEAQDDSTEATDESQTDDGQQPTDAPTLELLPEETSFGVTGQAAPQLDVDSNQDTATSKTVQPTSLNNAAPIGASIPQPVLFQQPTKLAPGEPQIIKTFNPLFEHSKAGDVIGNIVLKNYPSNIGIAFDNSGNATQTSTSNYFAIEQVGNTNTYLIKLTAGGAAAVNLLVVTGTAPSIDNLFIYLSDNTTMPGTLLPNAIATYDGIIHDAVINLNPMAGDVGLTNHLVTGATALSGYLNIGDFDGDGDLDFAKLDGSGHIKVYDSPDAGILYTSTSTGYTAISAAGDLNNDGYADIIGSDKHYDPASGGAPDTGIVVKILGDDLPVITTSNVGITSNESDFLGNSIAGIGDFNGDGYSDIIAGAPGYNSTSGRFLITNGYGTAVYSEAGGTTQGLGQHVAGAGDINGDGFSDVLVTDNNDVISFYFGNTTGSAGGFTFSNSNLLGGSSAGDMNGDGFDDVAVYLTNGAAVDTYIIYGSTGLTGSKDINFLENLDNALKIHHAGASSGATNYNVLSLGDINGDGFDDIQIGYGSNQYKVYGGLGGTADYVTDGAPNDGDGNTGIVTATSIGQSLVGDVNFNDGTIAANGLRMTGGKGNNVFEINNNSFKNIEGGAGHDTINFATANSSLNLTNVNFESISQIEEIKFGGAGQTITLNAENIFNLLKTSDTGDLTIKGDGTSTLDFKAVANYTGGILAIMQALDELGTDSTNAGQATFDGQTYNHVSIGGYNLYIDTDVIISVTSV